MALQLGALRAALIDGGTEPELADKAAEEMAGYEVKLGSLDTRLAVLGVMVGGLYVVAVPIIWMLLRIAAKLGALP